MYYNKVFIRRWVKLKKIFVILLVSIMIVFNTSISYADFYEALPADIGSSRNTNIMEILYPEKKKVTSYSETYLISCLADPGTEITLYERYDDTLVVPLTVNNEAITGVVGESGLYLIEMNFRPNSTNTIMFFAQKGSKYQSEFRTIVVEEEEETEEIEYTLLNIQEFVWNVESLIKKD